MRFIQFIADYGKNDPAFAEVIQRLMMEVPDAAVNPLSVSPFATIETGFWTAQLGLAVHPEGMIIYTNTAPRKDELVERVANAGEGLVYAKLKNGVEVVGVNSGYSFSFLKDNIAELWKVDVANAGSQFRSREFYPQIVGKVARGDYSFKLQELNAADLPEVPQGLIGAIDGYGNIKTTYRLSQAKVLTTSKGALNIGDQITVKIGEVEHQAIFNDGTFSVKDGEIAFAPGSSGGHLGGNDYFMEVFLRGGSAAEKFGGKEALMNRQNQLKVEIV